MPSGTTHYDVILVGSGQGGTPLARAFAEAGRKTLLVEASHVGGTCINEGCSPTKTMVASARVAYLNRRGIDFGVKSTSLSIDQVRIRQRKRDIVESFRDGSERRLIAAGVEIEYAQAQFVAPRTFEVSRTDGTSRRVAGETVVLSTGLRNAPPDIPGLDAVTSYDNASIMELDRTPEHLIVIGAGYIGLEFAQMFRRFGARVTVIGRSATVLGREDRDIADAMANILREDGIDLRLDTSTRSVEPLPNGGVRLTVEHRGVTSTIDGSHLLLAAGRRPNTDDLNATAGGVSLDQKGFVVVTPRLETTEPGTYAIGDVKGGPAFTHIAYDDFRILKRNLLDGEEATITGRLLPYTVFTDPQLGRVGMTEAEARQTGKYICVASMPMSHVARALEMDETRGFMKAIVDMDSSQILGAAVLGVEGGELATLFQVAMMGRLPYTALRDNVFSHPTMAESLNNLFASLEP